MKRMIAFIIISISLQLSLKSQQATTVIRIEDGALTQSLANIDIWIAEKEFERAKNEAEKLLLKKPNNLRLIDKLEEIYIAMGQRQKISAMYQNMIKQAPAQFFPYRKLAEFIRTETPPKPAGPIILEWAHNTQANDDEIQMAFEKLVGWGESESAIEMIAYFRKNRQRPALLAFELSNLYDLEGETEKSIDEILQFLTDKKEPQVHYNHRQFLINTLQDRSIQSASYFEYFRNKTKKNSADNNDLRLLIAKIQYLRGEFKQAYTHYRELDRELNAKGRILYQLARLTLEERDYEHAVEILHSLNNEYHFETATEVARCYEDQGMIDSAGIYYRYAIMRSSSPQTSNEARYQLARLYLNLNRYPEAFSMIDSIDIRYIDKQNQWQIEWLKGELLLRLGQLEESQAYFHKLQTQYLQDAEKIGDILFILGKLEFYQQRYINAMPYFKQVLSRYTRATAYNDLIDWLSIIEKIGDQLEMLDLFAQGQLALEQANWRQSVIVWLKFIQEYSEFPAIQQIFVRLVKSWQGENNPEEIVHAARQGIDLDPETFSAMWLHYAWALACIDQNQFQEAVPHLQIILRSSNGIALKAQVRHLLEQLRQKGLVES